MSHAAADDAVDLDQNHSEKRRLLPNIGADVAEPMEDGPDSSPIEIVAVALAMNASEDIRLQRTDQPSQIEDQPTIPRQPTNQPSSQATSPASPSVHGVSSGKPFSSEPDIASALEPPTPPTATSPEQTRPAAPRRPPRHADRRRNRPALRRQSGAMDGSGVDSSRILPGVVDHLGEATEGAAATGEAAAVTGEATVDDGFKIDLNSNENPLMRKKTSEADSKTMKSDGSDDEDDDGDDDYDDEEDNNNNDDDDVEGIDETDGNHNEGFLPDSKFSQFTIDERNDSGKSGGRRGMRRRSGDEEGEDKNGGDETSGDAATRESGSERPGVERPPLERQGTMRQRFAAAIGRGTFKYYFQHPLLRIFVAFIVTFFNFMIYLEDPVPHSQLYARIPVIGHAFSLVLTKYPSTGGMVFLKVVSWMVGIVLGMSLGITFHHLVLRRFLPHMFKKSRGSWFVMFITTIVCVFVVSLIYSAIAGAVGEPKITSDLGIKDELFFKLAASGTWMGDLLTFCMVFDLIMQDAKNHDAFKNWAIGLRGWWNSEKQPHRRIIIFWSFILVTSAIVIFCIFQPFFKWDGHLANWYLTGKPTFPNNQVWRIALASTILTCDLLIVMQDWTFPGFAEGDLNLKLPGLNKDSFILEIYSRKSYEEAVDKIAAADADENRIRSTCSKLFVRLKLWVLGHLSTLGEIEITGKWFNYGVLCFVMILDLNMLRNQIVYDPADYCQYTIEYDRICVINDLNPVWESRNESAILNNNYDDVGNNTDCASATLPPPPSVRCYCPFAANFSAASKFLPGNENCLSPDHTKLVSQFTPGLGKAPGLLFLIPVLPAIVSMIVVLKKPDWNCCEGLKKPDWNCCEGNWVRRMQR